MTVAMTTVLLQGSTPQVRRFVGTNDVALGNTFGAAETFTRSISQPSNRETEFLGSRYCWVGNSIRLFDGTNWNVVRSLSPGMVSTETGVHTGLHVINVNNTPCLIGLYINSSNTTVYRVKFDGTTWSELDLAVGDYFLGSPRDFARHNLLYVYAKWNSGNKRGEFAFDPSTDTYSVIDSTSGSGRTLANSPAQDWCVWKDRLFKLAPAVSGFAIFERLAGYYQSLLTFENQFNALSNVDTCGPVAFVSNNVMYIIYWVQSSSSGATAGYYIHKVTMDMSGNLTDAGDVTTAVLPSAIQHGNGFPLPGNGAKWFVFQDQVSNPGGAVITWLLFSIDYTAGNQWALYQFVDDVTPLIFVGAVGNVADATPHAKNGGGNRLFRPNQNTVDEIKLLPVSTGLRISFKVYGGNQINIRFFFTTNGDAPTNACTLSNPSAGTVSGSSLLQDINADGVTTYTVDWPFPVDGVTLDANVDVVGYAFS